MRRWVGTLCVSAVALAVAADQAPVRAQPLPEPEPPPTVEPLTGVPLPPLDQAERATIVKSEAWLEVLGKALFWDSAVGGDGNACASCHFNAGADPRLANQLSPGLLRVDPAGDGRFGGIAPPTVVGRTRGGKVAGANVRLDASDFPFRVLADPTNRNSAIRYDTNDVFSSQGVFDGTFIGLEGSTIRLVGGVHDFCGPGVDTIFRTTIGGQPRSVRKVEPRNTPTMINAAFFHRNFWDGRANNVFNGASPFGPRDRAARIHRNVGGVAVAQTLRLENMSLASQAVGPPNSDFEMACGGRGFADIGRKMLPRTALAGQRIAPTDSVFASPNAVGGGVVTAGNVGLIHTYRRLVERAFRDDLWSGPNVGGFTLAEENFDLFFGMAVDKYERSLISDQTKLEGFNGGLDAQEQAGKAVFEGKGRCVNCHVGPLLSGAAIPPRQPEQLVEHMLMGDDNPAFYDGGFYNIGVRPTNEDVGVGGKDPWGNPLSFSRQHVGGDKVDSFRVDETTFEEPCATTPCDTRRVAVDGAFKTPGLRNVALTAPYFHNGGEATLESVVDFYNRGGNRRGNFPNDTTGSGPLGQGPVRQSPTGTNLDPDIRSLGLTAEEKRDLVAFLKALTDNRVRCHAKPFDHPELIVTDGHTLVAAGTRAADIRLRLRAVGRAGYNASGCAPNTGNLFGYNLVGAVGSGKMLERLP